MGEYSHLAHTFLPVYDESSELLILGSFPSVKSRKEGFYYGHPRNRFWNVGERNYKSKKGHYYVGCRKNIHKTGLYYR